MKVSKEELIKMANLSDLNIEEDKLDNYLANLEDILNFAKVLDNAPIEDLDITISANQNSNAFRKDEIVDFDNKEGLLSNSKEVERNMFKIPKVIN